MDFGRLWFSLFLVLTMLTTQKEGALPFVLVNVAKRSSPFFLGLAPFCLELASFLIVESVSEGQWNSKIGLYPPCVLIIFVFFFFKYVCFIYLFFFFPLPTKYTTEQEPNRRFVTRLSSKLAYGCIIVSETTTGWLLRWSHIYGMPNWGQRHMRLV